MNVFTRFLMSILITIGLISIANAQDAEKVFAKASKSVFTIETPTSYGTGFMVAPDIMVTCYHVVKGAGAKISLREASGVTADYIIHNEEADIAVFRLSRKLENYLRFTESVNVGSTIFVIGTPLGALERSITSGIVSQKYKVEGLPQLQITAPISPGSSGSPVLNKDGKVVGMAQATLREGQANNFALDYTVIKSFIPTNETNKRSDNKKPEVKKPIKNYIVGTEKSIRYLRPTNLYKMPDTSSKQVWECRGLTYGQAYKTKYPNWVAVSMTNNSVSYCRAENVEFVDARTKNNKADPFYVEEPKFLTECVKEFCSWEFSNTDLSKLINSDAYQLLLKSGPKLGQLLLNKIEFYTFIEAADPDFGYKKTLSYYEETLSLINELNPELLDLKYLFKDYYYYATYNQKYQLLKCLRKRITSYNSSTYWAYRMNPESD